MAKRASPARFALRSRSVRWITEFQLAPPAGEPTDIRNRDALSQSTLVLNTTAVETALVSVAVHYENFMTTEFERTARRFPYENAQREAPPRSVQLAIST